MSGKTTFLIHIGTGKTGSTSIQRFFKDHRAEHKSLGLHYLGLHLSLTDQPILYPWQSEDEEKVFDFQRLDDSTAYLQLEHVLCQLLDQNEATLPSCFVWSFESIYERPQVYAKLIASLKERYPIEMKILALTRNHIDYLKTSYNQWGLKHKTYQGPVLPFTDWAELKKGMLSYGRKLKIWDDQFGEHFMLLNYDCLDDAVVALIQNLPSDICQPVLDTYKGFKRYELTPRPELLALYALFHNRNYDSALPLDMVELLTQVPQLRHPHPALPCADELFPGIQQIQHVMQKQMLAYDAALIDGMLKKRDQPPLQNTVPGTSDNTTQVFQDNYQLLTSLMSMLLTVVVEQGKKIQCLEAELVKPD